MKTNTQLSSTTARTPVHKSVSVYIYEHNHGKRTIVSALKKKKKDSSLPRRHFRTNYTSSPHPRMF